MTVVIRNSNIFTTDIMPVETEGDMLLLKANAALIGRVVKYLGPTTKAYEHGAYYKLVADEEVSDA